MKPGVFFIQMPAWAREPNLAIAQLAAYLRHHGCEVEAIDLNMELYHRFAVPQGQRDMWAAEIDNLWLDAAVPERVLGANRSWIESRVLDRVSAADRPVVCFPVTGPSIPSSLILTRWIKEARPDALVVFGGEFFAVNGRRPDAGGLAELWAAGVDAAVVGDGEEALLEIVMRHGEGRGVAGCPGALWREKDGRAFFGGERAYVDLNRIPPADWSVLDLSLYPKVGDPEVDRRGVVGLSDDLIIMASRGCVRRCSFCGHRTAWKGFRRMSGRRIYEEISHQRSVRGDLRPGRSEIKFYDLLINGDMKALSDLCDLVIGDSRPQFLWREANAVIRPEMSHEFCRKLHAAGCRWLIIGLESGSQKVLDSMDKGQTVAQMKEVLKNIDRAGIKVRGNFMFGHPGETEEDFEKTIEFVKEMHPYIHHVYPSFTMTHLEGRLGLDPEAWGVAGGQHEHFWKSRDGLNDYPARLERYERFIREAYAAGANVITCLNMPVGAHIEFKLGEYHAFLNEPREALKHYRKYLDLDRGNAYVSERVRAMEAVCEPA